MKEFINKCLKSYDVLLNIIFIVLVLWTMFAICYYCMPEQTSQIIAKALAYTDNTEFSSKLMDYINGFTIGAGFPLWFSQKAMISRYINNSQNKYSQMSTQEILAENIELMEIANEFQKAEALRFVNSPTMPAKARVQYKKYLDALDRRDKNIATLKAKVVPAKKHRKPKEKIKVQETSDKLDSLV